MKYQRANFHRLLAVCLLCLVGVEARAELKTSQARKALTRVAGFELPNSSVRVRRITPTSPSSAEVVADIKSIFKLEQDQRGRWRVAEVRTRPDQWDAIDLIAEAAQSQAITGECNVVDPPFKGSALVDPSVKRTRCLLGSLLGVELPSDAIRIQEVEPLALPFASQPSAVVVAWITVEARMLNDDKRGWRVSEVKTGNRQWVPLDALVAQVNELKRKQARNDLQAIARALEQFRNERGFYVVSDSHAVVIDHLNPRYLAKVIRLDPWHRPYKYQGDRERFTLSSTGPDGKENTADDVFTREAR